MLPTLLTLVFLTTEGALAHMALWHPSGYGFNKGFDAVTPLSSKAFDDWWFHGFIDETPSETLSLTPGQDLTVQIACSKDYTTYGSSPSDDACPGDSGAYHSGGTTGTATGWTGNNEAQLMGCALAIAFKSDPHDVQPEDFVVMSVQQECVRQRDTVFSIPSNLPACPEGGCTCSWFWEGKNSALEMYMAAFRCDVEGGEGTDYPTPVEPRKNAVDGPTQPYYWANDLNNLGYTPDWESKPSYNSAWGWVNGAQEGAFESASTNQSVISQSSTAGSPASTKSSTATGSIKSVSFESTASSSKSSLTTWRQLQASATTSSSPSPTRACKRRHHRKHRS